MKTKKRRNRANEEREADLVDDMLTLILAGDRRPRVSEYYLTDNVVQMILERASPIHDDGFYNSGPKKPSGMVCGGRKPGTVEVIECEQVTRSRLMSLALWWEPLHEEIPDNMYAASVAVMNIKSGGVVSERRRYMHLPPGSQRDRSGTGWFPFPVNIDFATSYKRITSGSGDHGTYREGYQLSSHGASQLDESCSMSINMLKYCEWLGSRVWSVSLVPHGQDVGVTLYTDAEGVTGFFNLREKGESGRRSALRHWVRMHTRRTSGGNVSDVRRHLRGQTVFEWFGMKGVVNVPSNEQNTTTRGES